MPPARPFPVGRMPKSGLFPSTPVTYPGTRSARREPPLAVQVRTVSGQFVPGGQRTLGFAWEGIDVFQERFEKMRDVGHLEGILESYATQMHAHARLNAPWQNRTHRARQTLRSVLVKNQEGEYSIFLGHGVFYGVYLETYLGLPIILPTIIEFAPRMMGDIADRVWLGNEASRA